MVQLAQCVYLLKQVILKKKRCCFLDHCTELFLSSSSSIVSGCQMLSRVPEFGVLSSPGCVCGGGGGGVGRVQLALG